MIIITIILTRNRLFITCTRSDCRHRHCVNKPRVFIIISVKRLACGARRSVRCVKTNTSAGDKTFVAVVYRRRRIPYYYFIISVSYAAFCPFSYRRYCGRIMRTVTKHRQKKREKTLTCKLYFGLRLYVFSPDHNCQLNVRLQDRGCSKNSTV